VKVSELKGEKLDYWVAKAVGYTIAPVGGVDEQVVVVSKTGLGIDYLGLHVWNPTQNWSQLGPLIEEHWASIVKKLLRWAREDGNFVWMEDIGGMAVELGLFYSWPPFKENMKLWFCRAIVASKYGDEFKYEERRYD